VNALPSAIPLPGHDRVCIAVIELHGVGPG